MSPCCPVLPTLDFETSALKEPKCLLIRAMVIVYYGSRARNMLGNAPQANFKIAPSIVRKDCY